MISACQIAKRRLSSESLETAFCLWNPIATTTGIL